MENLDIRHRWEELDTLRQNVCQDFLRMLLKAGWQKELYKTAEYEVTINKKYKDRYQAVYDKMRDSKKAVDDYSIDDMDITLITGLVNARFMGVSVSKETKYALKKIKTDRNTKDHSGGNEKPEKLYLQALLDLCNIRDFVRAVDNNETGIDNESRLEFRQKYIPKIDKLKELLDEERIELVQKEKSMRKDIQKVLDSDDPSSAWGDVYEWYENRYEKMERNRQAFDEFVICASDAGVVFAHFGAALHFLSTKDFAEAERRLFMMYNAKDISGDGYAHDILTIINDYLDLGNGITEGMQEIINGLVEQGFVIENTENGFYYLANERAAFIQNNPPFWREGMTAEEFDREREYYGMHLEDVSSGKYKPLWKQKEEEI